MSPNPIAILATGMVTGVGLDAPSSCAAIRCAYDNVQETRFMDKGGEWVMGSEVPLEGKLWGREKLLAMASMAIQECMAGLQEAPQPITADQIPLLLVSRRLAGATSLSLSRDRCDAVLARGTPLIHPPLIWGNSWVSPI